MPHKISKFYGLLLVFALVGVSQTLAADPLHVQIDQLVAKSQVGPTAPVSSDAEFLRRVYLDFTGTIPSTTEARAFLADQSPDKRTKLIDRLLADARYVRHMANTFDVMLMERRADKHVKTPEWQSYLEASFATNKPYNQLAAEILGSDGADPKLRAPDKFLLDREMEPNLLTREVSRMFFGRDFECAQCHDHPLIGDYLQSDFYGIYAFVQRSYLFQPDKKKPAVIAEKAEGAASFKSVFTDESGTTRPRLPGGKEIEEPTFKKGEEWQVKPDPKNKNLRTIPKFSRRAQLAKLATDGTNDAFNQNIANRLWAHMLGRGLVHPVDLHHSDNPPTHPELLKVLGDEFAAMKFDMKVFLREIALSQTYQRSFQLPTDIQPQIASAKQQLAQRQVELSQQKTSIEKIKQTLATTHTSLEEAKKTVSSLPAELEKAKAATAEAQKQFDELSKTLASLKTQLAQKQGIEVPLNEALTKASEAASKLPDDKELAAVLVQLRTRLQSVTSERDALTKSLIEKTDATNAAMLKLAAAQKMSDELTSRMSATTKQIDEQQKTVATLEPRLSAEQLTSASVRNQIEILDALVNYGDKLASNNSNPETVGRIRSELFANQRELEIEQGDRSRSQAELASAESALAAATKALSNANTQLAIKQELTKLVTQAAAQTELARQKQPEDKELVAIATTMKAQRDKLTNAVAQLQKTATTQQAAIKSANDRIPVVQKTIDDLNAKIAVVVPKVQALEVEFEKANAGNASVDAAYEKVTDFLTKRFAMATVQPMTPEQLTWSVLQATGMVERQQAASAAEVNKKTPLKPEEQNDPAKVAQRNQEIEKHAYDKLKGNVAKFIKLFAAAPGQPQGDFFATVDQALFFANGGELRGWLAPSGENLTARMMKIEDPRTIAEEMYLSVLTRQPTDVEINDVTQYLASRPNDKSVVVQEIVWALITSIEFRFQH